MAQRHPWAVVTNTTVFDSEAHAGWPFFGPSRSANPGPEDSQQGLLPLGRESFREYQVLKPEWSFVMADFDHVSS